MNRYVVKIGFWLRAYDGFVVEAACDADAIAQAKVEALRALQSSASPEHVEFDQRHDGEIAYIDRIEGDDRIVVAEILTLDDNRIHPPT